MNWANPPIPWSEFERIASGATRRDDRPHGADGGDSPAWSRKRAPYEPRARASRPEATVVPYAELHAHSHYSFLDGASSPEHLVEEAVHLGLTGLGLTDHDGLYGIVRMAEAAERVDLMTVFGAELSLGLGAPQNGVADPEGDHLVVLARKESGYHRLAGAITSAQLAPGAEKGHPVYALEDLSREAQNSWLVLTGCRKGAVRRALESDGSPAAARELDRLIDLFGRDNVVVELFDHGDPRASSLNDALADLAARARLPVIATNNVHFAGPETYPLASALAAIRARRSLDEMDGWLPASAGAHLRSGAEMGARFSRYSGAVERTVEIAADLSFSLRSARPNLPKLDVPAGHTPISWLRELVRRGAQKRYPNATPDIHDRLERELRVIEDKDFPGYFLIVEDIVGFARGRGILCQGRGSAANSAVCYVLGITAVDSIARGLPFERFLSALREEEPDIDVDFDSDRREEVIQYVYERYGRRNAAQVANVISYRPKNAVRDVAKALGYSQGQQDAWSRQIERWGSLSETHDHDIPPAVTDLAQQLLKAPRHLGIHSGGMVLTENPVGEVVPIEHARKENRTVLQWDKDDCAWMGLVKFDLLGLGILAALQYTFDLVEEHTGEQWNLDSIPKEEAGVYDMLCRADAIGVFQVESRAQMGTLPRLLPRRYYDLVIEIALIRPGPIQGGAVHPFIRRKTGEEAVTYPHPLLEPVLERTLGVPLFQEQLMQMAVAVGGCSAADADLLRRAMGSKRGVERIESLKATLFEGMARNGLDLETSEDIYARIQAFANFGFAESHALSFALLVYSSAWLKLHYPAAFLAALLRAQPMGFYSPLTLTADARRHGVEVRRPSIQRSLADATLEELDTVNAAQAHTRPECCDADQPPVGEFDRAAPDLTATHRRDGGFAVRLGLAAVTGIGADLAQRIVDERQQSGDFVDLADLSRRAGLSTEQLEALAAAGAFDSLGISQREAFWQAGEASAERADQLAGSSVSVQPPLLPVLTSTERLAYDIWSTGISPDDHPISQARGALTARGVSPIAALAQAESGRRVRAGGAVTHRQRPQTAGGIVFMNLEDETGLLNVVVSTGVWNRYRRLAREAPALVVRGILERSPEGIINLVADRFEELPLKTRTRSRDFR
ncbi:error-prone DNA polymerase [Agreia sp. VKM Ac-1783]|uniref:error-prone DNA polymerase n=1 Tax=Agreia sp. VKM Ac-1783 TaxID=1938889 RepID=UPI000A2ABD3C|nr:error-prone DNA polymerase [Agreia sp. VKM Ac-1783]SMQ71974.1 error-prone DNA polymerase, DnaE-like [Agreia sp. VKM Ac-1783]